jgi:hypothetical protein
LMFGCQKVFMTYLFIWLTFWKLISNHNILHLVFLRLQIFLGRLWPKVWLNYYKIITWEED